MSILAFAIGSALGGLLALGVGWLLVDRLIWPWVERREGKPPPEELDWRAMFVKYVELILYRESYDFLDEVEWTPEEQAAAEQAAEEARASHTAPPSLP
jgi:hypothetical protein